MPHHSQPIGLGKTAVYCLVKQPYGNLFFCGKCFFFRNMTFFIQLRKIFSEPFLWKVKFIVHKAVPAVPPQKQGIRRTGNFPFCPGDRGTDRFTPAECFPFFTKHESSTDSIPRTCPTCFESCSW